MPLLGQPAHGKGAPLQEAIQKPFEARQGAGRWRLMHLLRQVMIRAAKSDLITIPPCHAKVSCGAWTNRHSRSLFSLGLSLLHMQSVQCKYPCRW